MAVLLNMMSSAMYMSVPRLCIVLEGAICVDRYMASVNNGFFFILSAALRYQADMSSHLHQE
jgi:hypothetical protein